MKSSMGSVWQRVYRSRFVRDVLTLSTGTAFAQAIAVLTLPVLTRLYSPEEFGIFALYAAAVSILTLLATYNLETLVLLSRSNREAGQLVWLVVAIASVAGLVLLALMAVGRDQVAGWLRTPALAPWLLTLPVSLFLLACYQALHYWLMRQQKFSAQSQALVTRAAMFALVAVAFGYLKLLPDTGAGLVIAFLVAEIARLLVMVIRTRTPGIPRIGPPTPRLMPFLVARNFRMSMTLSTSSAMGLVGDRLPHLMLSSFFGPASLGFYSVVERVISAPSELVAKAIGNVFRQRASVQHRNEKRFDRLTLRTLAVTSAMAVIPFGLAIAFAPFLFERFLGAGWRPAGEYASILMIGSFVAFVITPIDSATVIVGAQRFLILWALARLLLTASLFPLLSFGLIGDVHTCLYGLVAVRVLMLLLDGWASYVCARTGEPVLAGRR